MSDSTPPPPPGGRPPSPYGDEPHHQPPARGPRRALVVGVVVVLVLALAGGAAAAWRAARDDRSGSSASPSSTSTEPSASGTPESAPTPGLARFYQQRLHWTDCRRDKCARLTVPLDYAHPDGPTIKLAVLKVPSRSKSRRGSLVVNPGGPGAPGTDYAAYGSLQFGQALTRAYDIVGFDPRGVGASDPVRCLDTHGLDELLAFDPDPDTEAESTEMDRLLRGFGNGCLQRSGDIVRHVSTEEAARDMDILRAALGERKLDYLGASYGTFLGATYADLFPHNVGRFVLDGALDPSLSTVQLNLQQAQGFETALRAYVQDCVDQGDCFLGDTVDAGVHRVRELLDQLDQHPLPTDTDRELTEGLGALGIWLPLYVKEMWGQLTAGLQQAIQEHRGSVLLGLADTYTDRGPEKFSDNSMEALYAVNCLDNDDYIPTSEVPRHFAEFEKASPTFGRIFAYATSSCGDWPVHSGKKGHPLHAAGSPPIVVIGTTRDPATPLRWARALASQLQQGRLVVRDGDGHTGFNRGNRCVDGAVVGWLVGGKLPRDGLHC